MKSQVLRFVTAAFFTSAAWAACSPGGGGPSDPAPAEALDGAPGVDVRPSMQRDSSSSADLGDTNAAGAGGAADAAAASVDAAADAQAFAPPDAAGEAGAPASPAGLPGVLIDSDAAGDIDDAHALAYMMFNADKWRIEGVTTNRTDQPGAVNTSNIDEHTAEAKRVVHLCDSEKTVPVYQGAQGVFGDIRGKLNDAAYDGKAAVDFIIATAKRHSEADKLVLLAIGKLTNVALALAKAPEISKNIYLLWRGSHWWPGHHDAADEYNEANDLGAVKFIMEGTVQLDIAVVRWGVDPDGDKSVAGEQGTFYVFIGTGDVDAHVAGRGPTVSAIQGRGTSQTFTKFGDYSRYLIGMRGAWPLFDMAAASILKKQGWAKRIELGAPTLVGSKWQENNGNPRKIGLYRGFDKPKILNDFYSAMSSYKLQK